MARRVSAWLSLFILFVHLIAISTTSPTRPSIGVRGPVTSLARHQSKAPALHDPTGNAALTRRKAPSIRRNDWSLSYTDEGLALWFSVYEPYLRIENAASALHGFFTSLTYYALRIWIAKEPLKAFSVQIGALAIDFRCEVIPIPWQTVASFAQTMADRATSGFVGAWEAMLQDVVSGVVVYVKLRTLLNAATAA